MLDLREQYAHVRIDRSQARISSALAIVLLPAHMLQEDIRTSAVTDLNKIELFDGSLVIRGRSLRCNPIIGSTGHGHT